MKIDSHTAHTTATQNSSALGTLEPHGAHIQLRDLLRWQLAAPFIPLESRNNNAQMIGNRQSTLRGRGIDFDEVRPYQSGDDVRTIDWRVTARTGKTHTKVFHEEKERPVLLVIDLRSSMYFGSKRSFKSVVAANAAALLAWTTVTSGDRVGAILISDHRITDIKPQRSRHTLLKLFRHIITLDTQQSGTSSTTNPIRWQQAMQQLRSIVRPGSCIIMLSDFYDWQHDCQQTLHPILRHSQCFAIHIHDVLEMQLPIIGIVSLRKNMAHLNIDTSDKKLMARYQQDRAQHQHMLASTMQALKIPLLHIKTGDSILTALRQFFSPTKNTGVRDE